ncbi:MAG: 3-oxoacyl-ACP reductase FabG [Deltaproteobacteria bacterium]|nr:3-oxoacyl-ACP reductase FabG [Deltaproteobacteria bacterium]
MSNSAEKPTLFDLTGRTALVTGASRGIGRATAIALASRGAHVAINYQSNESAARDTLSAIEQLGGTGELLPFDVSQSDAVTRAVDDLASRKGLHIAVANAGVTRDGLLLRMKDDDLETVLAVNLKGPAYLSRAAVRVMMRQRFGRLIFMSSIVGEMGNAGQAAYAAAKSGLLGLARSIAREYGARNVTANVVSPGFIETEMTSGLPEEVKKKYLEATPVGRLGRPDEIAAAVVYLASNEASFVTGTVLRVNGGLYL